MNRTVSNKSILYSQGKPFEAPTFGLDFTNTNFKTLWAGWFWRADGSAADFWIDFPHTKTRNGYNMVVYPLSKPEELCRVSFHIRQFKFDDIIEPFLDWLMEVCPVLTEQINEVISYVPPSED